MPLLSVIVPAYNESKTIRQILEKINNVDLDKEIIVIENGSTDDTGKILREIPFPNLKVIHHLTNRGKGGAVLTGLAHAQGDYVIIQDADLEYDPGDYPKLMDAVRDDGADLILGARFVNGHQGLFVHRLGNKFLTGLLNVLFCAQLNDYATCYKLARKATFDRLDLKAAGFNFDVEVICNALKKKMRLKQIPVSYYPRSYKEGKKIRWLDGLWTIIYIFYYRLGGK